MVNGGLQSKVAYLPDYIDFKHLGHQIIQLIEINEHI